MLLVDLVEHLSESGILQLPTAVTHQASLRPS